jgi:predicted nucleic acid-binding protein
VALAVPDDKWHRKARESLEALSRLRLPLVTTNHVLGETYTLLMRTRGHAAAWRFKEGVDASQRLEVVVTDGKLEGEAWALLRKFEDQRFSFVDAVSFALMQRRRMHRAFAFDADFAAAGFERIPLDVPAG